MLGVKTILLEIIVLLFPFVQPQGKFEMIFEFHINCEKFIEKCVI